MDEVEYTKQMAEIEEKEREQHLNTTPSNEDDEGIPNIDELIEKVEEVKQPNEVEEKLAVEENKTKEVNKQADALKKMPGLREFMETEEFLRLGTKARIPVALDLNGYAVKVFVRALSRNEIQACRVQANNTDDDMDFLAVMKACTDENGEPFDREILDQLGYARIRDISEAIGIASGENPENTESAIRKQVIDNFLQKIEDET